MGLDVVLQDERGCRVDSVDDDTGEFAALLPAPGDASYVCIRFINPYGDTVFNTLQAPVLRDEIERIRVRASGGGIVLFLDKVLELVKRCEGSAHLYVRFCGD